MTTTIYEPVSIPVPEKLRERLGQDCPARLWSRGDFSRLYAPSVAIVGARACSPYGRSVARSWSRDLAAQGFTIVSGLARGIDGEAHRAAIEAGGFTVAVLGCGIDRVYPAAHGELARRMIEAGGAVVSEYEPGIEPAPWRFPARNRIVAGLVDAVLVVEARERSGALITADFAQSFNVPLLAIPGEVTSPLSLGTNQLLHDGNARIATTVGDVVGIIEQTRDYADLVEYGSSDIRNMRPR